MLSYLLKPYQYLFITASFNVADVSLCTIFPHLHTVFNYHHLLLQVIELIYFEKSSRHVFTSFLSFIECFLLLTYTLLPLTILFFSTSQTHICALSLSLFPFISLSHTRPPPYLPPKNEIKSIPLGHQAFYHACEEDSICSRARFHHGNILG